MKTRIIQSAITVIAVSLVSSEVRGETAADIGTLPSQKVPASVDKGDRNPFATKIKPIDVSAGAFTDAESEESKIRQVFANLHVSGRVPASHGAPRVLVGDLILKEGAEVPQVIENQTDELRVTRITDKEVEITWVNEEETEAPRKLLIPINLRPEVSFLLPGRAALGAGGQFVKMPATPEGEKEGGDEDEDPYADDEDRAEEDQPGKAEAPAKPERVSPFGLFRR